MASAKPNHLRLETPRLVLRPLVAADAPLVQRFAGEWDIARFTGAIPHPYPEGAAAAWIASLGADDAETVWAIACRADDSLIGCIGLRPHRDTRSASFGYWVGKPHWGQGFAPEALWALVDHAFNTLDIDHVHAAAMPENVGSIRVQEKVGFRYVRDGVEAAPARGGPMKVEIRNLSRQAWLEARRASPEDAPALPIVLVAAVALVDADGRVLIAQRPEGKLMAGLWEFPGGKLHAGETPEAALIRELKEELAIDVRAACLAPFTFASHRYADFHLLMPLYVCRRWEGQVTPLEGQAIQWVRPARLADYPMPPADHPLVAMLRDFL